MHPTGMQPCINQYYYVFEIKKSTTEAIFLHNLDANPGIGGKN